MPKRKRSGQSHRNSRGGPQNFPGKFKRKQKSSFNRNSHQRKQHHNNIKAHNQQKSKRFQERRRSEPIRQDLAKKCFLCGKFGHIRAMCSMLKPKTSNDRISGNSSKMSNNDKAGNSTKRKRSQIQTRNQPPDKHTSSTHAHKKRKTNHENPYARSHNKVDVESWMRVAADIRRKACLRDVLEALPQRKSRRSRNKLVSISTASSSQVATTTSATT